jgi:hypothetical protein
MNQDERIVDLERRLAAAEARIAQLERRAFSPVPTTWPVMPLPAPIWIVGGGEAMPAKPNPFQPYVVTCGVAAAS